MGYLSNEEMDGSLSLWHPKKNNVIIINFTINKSYFTSFQPLAGKISPE